MGAKLLAWCSGGGCHEIVELDAEQFAAIHDKHPSLRGIPVYHHGGTKFWPAPAADIKIGEWKPIGEAN